MPSYVSTVDSGNLAGYLLTLKQGLSGLLERESLIDDRALDGIGDAILLFEESIAAGSGRGRRGALRASWPNCAPRC